MFTINGKEYDLHYTEARLELIENRLGKSVIGEFISSNGALPIASIKAHFAYALIDDEDRDRFVAAKTGMDLASAYMREAGYAAANATISECLQRDMGFLFRAG